MHGENMEPLGPILAGGIAGGVTAALTANAIVTIVYRLGDGCDRKRHNNFLIRITFTWFDLGFIVGAWTSYFTAPV